MFLAFRAAAVGIGPCPMAAVNVAADFAATLGYGRLEQMARTSR